jgi:hypothetical protein
VPRPTHPLLGFAAVVLALTLTGCSTNTQALTVGTAAKATKVAVAPVDGSKNVLTTKQAKASLPDATELGKKWIKGSATPSSGSSKSSTGTYAPEKCAFSSSNGQLKGMAVSPGKPIAKAMTSFKTKNSAGLSFDGTVVEVESFKDKIDTSTFAKISKVLGECKKFTYTDDSGVTSDFRILPLSLPKYGDQTLAFRMQATVSMFVLVIDFVEVANGHNLVSVYQAGLGGLDTKATGKAIDATMKHLDMATKSR